MNETHSLKVLNRVIDTQIEIDAEPELIWEALISTKSWGIWNKFIPKVEGNLQVGERIKISVVLSDAKPMVFKPKIYEVTTNEKILWGSSVLKILFKGEHAFLLERISDGKTLFRQIESFIGPLVLFMNSTLIKTEEGHHQMNLALKEYVENKKR